MNEWVDTKNCVPLIDGDYIVQTVYGRTVTMSYTFEGGWNTHKNGEGELEADNAMNDGYVARWFAVEKPKPIPTEWMNEYWKGVIERCGTE